MQSPNSFHDAYAGVCNTGTDGDKRSRDGRRSTNPFASWMDPIDVGFTGGLHTDHAPLSSVANRPATSTLPSHTFADQGASTWNRPQPPLNSQTFSPPTFYMPQEPPQSAASSSSRNPFMHTPYQPPPVRQQQQQQHDGTTATLQHRYSLGGSQFLEPEPISPGASTLVGSPMTPRYDHQRQFSWLGSAGQHQCPQSGTPSDFTKEQHSSPAAASTSRSGSFRSGSFGRKGFTPGASRAGEGHHGSSSTVEHAVAARTLGYFDHQQLMPGPYSQGKPSAWEPHVSVLMDDISLDNFSPSDSPPTSNEHHRGGSRTGLYNKGAYMDGANTPLSEVGRSSNTSMVTLLAQTNTASTNSSSSTLFGSFLSKSKNNSSFQKLSDLEPLEPPRQLQHQSISTTGSEGKVYSQRPKPKQFGKKKAGQGKGNSGNKSREALFSNERTFIQWIKFGILLGTMALTLCNFGALDSLAFYIGASVLMVAMSSLAYAAFLFHVRDRSLTRRLKNSLAKKQTDSLTGADVKGAKSLPDSQPREACYYDRLGPTLLCGVLLFAYSINFYLSITGGSAMNKDGGLSFFHQDQEE
ncbi:hypothetical protein EC968_006578 [Mortierella alpina]|nr:hypothetical protein EC968_006578 [Mortierella alpina]